MIKEGEEGQTMEGEGGGENKSAVEASEPSKIENDSGKDVPETEPKE